VFGELNWLFSAEDSRESWVYPSCVSMTPFNDDGKEEWTKALAGRQKNSWWSLSRVMREEARQKKVRPMKNLRDEFTGKKKKLLPPSW
jgi:hypothetical protein